MMLHRHQEAERQRNLTRLENLVPHTEQSGTDELFQREREPRKRGGRPKKPTDGRWRE